MSGLTERPWRIGAMESGMVAVDGANGEEVTGFVSPEDGQLIVAAPDLLDALKSFPGFLCSTDSGDRWIEKMRAAIAKATGQ